MDPDGGSKGLDSQKTHPLDQCLPEPFLKEASDKEVRRREDEKKGKNSVVEEVDHYIKSEIRISKLETNPNVQIQKRLRFGHLYFEHSCLFRNSCFEIRYYKFWRSYDLNSEFLLRPIPEA